MFYLQHDRFKAYDAIINRRLLWYGTNMAAVAAILKSGLRIMAHSGGLMGKGLYFASECSKSAGDGVLCIYTSYGLFFLYKCFGIVLFISLSCSKALK